MRRAPPAGTSTHRNTARITNVEMRTTLIAVNAVRIDARDANLLADDRTTKWGGGGSRRKSTTDPEKASKTDIVDVHRVDPLCSHGNWPKQRDTLSTRGDDVFHDCAVGFVVSTRRNVLHLIASNIYVTSMSLWA